MLGLMAAGPVFADDEEKNGSATTTQDMDATGSTTTTKESVDAAEHAQELITEAVAVVGNRIRSSQT